MSWFSSAKDKDIKNFWPVTSTLEGFGHLTEKDTAWACDSKKGFQTETQVWYSMLNDGSFLLVQVIWSYVGIFVIPATTQMTFKHYNPSTKKYVWKSVNTSALKPTGRGCKTDHFEITHSGTPSGAENYAVTAKLDSAVEINVNFTRPASAPGFKLGEGDKGGYSFFGKDPSDSKRDGFAVHRFHPLVKSDGKVTIDGAVIDATGEATFIHAIQGMKPDSLASRWNFAFFTNGGGEPDPKLGSVRAIQMEFQTTDSYGPKGAKSGRTKVNIGAVYSSELGTPLIVVGQTHTPGDVEPFPSLNGDVARATQSKWQKDADTTYQAPGAIEFQWAGDRVDGKGKASASVVVDPLGFAQGEGGLIEKVDVLAELPVIIKKALAAATGTKPYIYQYLNPATLSVETGEDKTEVKGWLFNEASFVSE